MKSHIGWVGLGRMGLPMSLRLLRAGYPVTVFNRTNGKEGIPATEGARVASSPSELMKKTEIVIIMVSDDQAVREIFLGDAGLLDQDEVSGKILINMSTVSPGISLEMAEQCRKAGHHYLDAPVSGSVRQADSGELVVMAGGEKDIFLTVRPILEDLGKMALYVGETGSGNAMKLAVNSLLGIISQGFSESILFARSRGLDIEDFLRIIQNSVLGNVYLKIKGEAILQDNYQAAFALKHMVKDLHLAKEAGFNTPLGKTAFETFRKAASSFGEEDIIAIIKAIKNE
jgi:3-hydroxyisobutyrate dehydrogenase